MWSARPSVSDQLPFIDVSSFKQRNKTSMFFMIKCVFPVTSKEFCLIQTYIEIIYKLEFWIMAEESK